MVTGDHGLNGACVHFHVAVAQDHEKEAVIHLHHLVVEDSVLALMYRLTIATEKNVRFMVTGPSGHHGVIVLLRVVVDSEDGSECVLIQFPDTMDGRALVWIKRQKYAIHRIVQLMGNGVRGVIGQSAVNSVTLVSSSDTGFVVDHSLVEQVALVTIHRLKSVTWLLVEAVCRIKPLPISLAMSTMLSLVLPNYMPTSVELEQELKCQALLKKYLDILATIFSH